jgi:hypothetical protein
MRISHVEGVAQTRPHSIKTTTPSDDAWLAMPFRDWCRKVGISYSHAYAMAAAGKIKITKLGSRSVITRDENNRVLAEGIR